MQDFFYILGQIFGIIGATMTICAFLYTEKNNTVKFLLIGGFFGSLQFALLGAYSGALISLFGFFRTFLSKKYENNNRTLWLMFLIISIITYISYESYLSLLPSLATFIATYALFKLKGVLFRIVLIVPALLWLSYSYSIGSIGGTIREIVILILHIKVILLSLAFAYKKEIYTLNYSNMTYLYNTSISKTQILWKNFLHKLALASHPFSQKKKGLISWVSFH